MSQDALESFAEACGVKGPLPLSVEVTGQPAPVPRPLRQPFAVIGRHARAGLRLDHPLVSQRHAYLQVLGGQPFVVDLGSRSGIHARGSRVQADWLPAAAPLRIGPFGLRWLGEVPGNVSPALPGFHPLTRCPPGTALTPVTLEFLDGRPNPLRWQINRVVTLIGNAPSCTVRLRSPRVSRFHCSLVATTHGVWVVDLLGRGGVCLNDVSVPFALLEDEDRLQLGEFVIRVSYDAPSAATLAPIRGTGLETVAPAAATSAQVESVLLPLIGQFGAMQEQMAEQFRQTLLMMFQMFSALHKDQMAFIQDEMDRLQQLTQELHHLQIEAARHPPAHEPGKPEPPAAPREGNRVAVAACPAPGTGAEPPTREPSAKPSAPSPVPRVPAPAVRAPGLPAGQDIHVWLCQRMAAVQEERQSRWQKLLGLLAGKRAEANLPKEPA